MLRAILLNWARANSENVNAELSALAARINLVLGASAAVIVVGTLDDLFTDYDRLVLKPYAESLVGVEPARVVSVTPASDEVRVLNPMQRGMDARLSTVATASGVGFDLGPAVITNSMRVVAASAASTLVATSSSGGGVVMSVAPDSSRSVANPLSLSFRSVRAVAAVVPALASVPEVGRVEGALERGVVNPLPSAVSDATAASAPVSATPAGEVLNAAVASNMRRHGSARGLAGSSSSHLFVNPLGGAVSVKAADADSDSDGERRDTVNPDDVYLNPLHRVASAGSRGASPSLHSPRDVPASGALSSAIRDAFVPGGAEVPRSVSGRELSAAAETSPLPFGASVLVRAGSSSLRPLGDTSTAKADGTRSPRGISPR